MRSVGFGHMPYDEAIARYDPAALREGFNDLPDGEVYFIPNPALGLWAERSRFG